MKEQFLFWLVLLLFLPLYERHGGGAPPCRGDFQSGLGTLAPEPDIGKTLTRLVSGQIYAQMQGICVRDIYRATMFNMTL